MIENLTSDHSLAFCFCRIQYIRIAEIIKNKISIWNVGGQNVFINFAFLLPLAHSICRVNQGFLNSLIWRTSNLFPIWQEPLWQYHIFATFLPHLHRHISLEIRKKSNIIRRTLIGLGVGYVYKM